MSGGWAHASDHISKGYPWADLPPTPPGGSNRWHNRRPGRPKARSSHRRLPGPPDCWWGRGPGRDPPWGRSRACRSGRGPNRRRWRPYAAAHPACFPSSHP
eukprot:scaffold8279_cov116-Isochrysis_galbana.AAC.3